MIFCVYSVCLGAGEAGVGISELLAYAIAMERKNTTGRANSAREARAAALTVTAGELAAARASIWLVDSQGLVTAGRTAVAATTTTTSPVVKSGEGAAAEGKAPMKQQQHALAGHKVPYAHAWPPAGE